MGAHRLTDLQTPALLHSVYLLVKLYDATHQYDRAIALLRRETTAHACSQLHKMLGDFLSKTNKPLEAVNVYASALTSINDEMSIGWSNGACANRRAGINPFDILASHDASADNRLISAPAIAISAASSSR
jgi:hypothetical protein